MGFSRQYYYKLRLAEGKERKEQAAVKAMVDKERKNLPRLGTRKLYHLIRPLLEQQKIKIGRDRLFDWMRYFDLLIKPTKRYIQTTNSRHWLRKYPNLIKAIQVTRPEQVWVSDITYLKTTGGNLYLSLITDAYSRKIMGYSIADNMEAATVSEALKMGIKNRIYQHTLIHHSDRGIQYCSKEYIQVADKNNIIMSMTENGDPYENALAERMNKTIKEEFLPFKYLINKQLMIKLISEAVNLYNKRRPHLSLQMKTPEMVHKQKIPAT